MKAKSKKKSKKKWVRVFRQILSYKKLRRRSETSQPDLDRTVVECPMYICTKAFSIFLNLTISGVNGVNICDVTFTGGGAHYVTICDQRWGVGKG